MPDRVCVPECHEIDAGPRDGLVVGPLDWRALQHSRYCQGDRAEDYVGHHELRQDLECLVLEDAEIEAEESHLDESAQDFVSVLQEEEVLS